MSALSRQKRDGRKARTRADVIAALKRYENLYGPPVTSACFNPATAKWADRQDLIDRYYGPDGPWPSLNSIRGLFGSFNAAREAAGLKPNPSGPRSYRAKNEHSPIRDVRVERVTVLSDESKRLRAELRLAETRALEAEERARTAVERMRRVEAEAMPDPAATAKIAKLREQLNREKNLSRDLTRQLRNIERRLARAEAREPKVVERVVEVPRNAPTPVRDLAEVERLTERLAAAEQRGERLRAQLAGSAEKLAVAHRRIEELTAAMAEMRERVTVEAAESRLVLAAERRAERAESDAAAARRAMAEQAAAVIGKLRPLTAAELEDLRRSGPAGPVMMKKAIEGLAKARAGRGDLSLALHELAAAAINWRDRVRP